MGCKPETEESMPIITIYPGAFTAGAEIADGVARTLGYRSINREMLLAASHSYGISEAQLDAIVEKD